MSDGMEINETPEAPQESKEIQESPEKQAEIKEAAEVQRSTDEAAVSPEAAVEKGDFQAAENLEEAFTDAVSPPEQTATSAAVTPVAGIEISAASPEGSDIEGRVMIERAAEADRGPATEDRGTSTEVEMDPQPSPAPTTEGLSSTPEIQESTASVEMDPQPSPAPTTEGLAAAPEIQESTASVEMDPQPSPASAKEALTAAPDIQESTASVEMDPQHSPAPTTETGVSAVDNLVSAEDPLPSPGGVEVGSVEAIEQGFPETGEEIHKIPDTAGEIPTELKEVLAPIQKMISRLMTEIETLKAELTSIMNEISGHEDKINSYEEAKDIISQNIEELNDVSHPKDELWSRGESTGVTLEMPIFTEDGVTFQTESFTVSLNNIGQHYSTMSTATDQLDSMIAQEEGKIADLKPTMDPILHQIEEKEHLIDGWLQQQKEILDEYFSR